MFQDTMENRSWIGPKLMQALQDGDSFITSFSENNEQVVYTVWIQWIKDWLVSQVGGRHEISALLRMVCNFKIMNL